MFSRLSNRLLQISLFVTNGKRTGKLKNHYSASNHVLIQGSVTFIQVYRTTWCEKSLGWLAGNSYYFYGNFAAITQVNYFIDLLLHLIFYILLRILAVVLHSRFYVMRIGFGLVPVWKKKLLYLRVGLLLASRSLFLLESDRIGLILKEVFIRSKENKKLKYWLLVEEDSWEGSLNNYCF